MVFGLTFLGCLAVTGLFRACCLNAPPAALADPYLVGVLILACKTTARLAMALLGISLLLIAYLLAPLDLSDLVQMLSFTALSLLVIAVTRSLRRRHGATLRTEVSDVPEERPR
jgi:membrane protein implicated in regulation of membrane protease activity